MLSVRPQPWSVELMLSNSLGILVFSGVALACACITSTMQLIVNQVSEGLSLELAPHVLNRNICYREFLSL